MVLAKSARRQTEPLPFAVFVFTESHLETVIGTVKHLRGWS